MAEKLQRVKEQKASMMADREEVLKNIEAKKEEIKAELETVRQKRQDLITGLEQGVAERQERIISQIDFENKGNFLTVELSSIVIRTYH